MSAPEHGDVHVVVINENMKELFNVLKRLPCKLCPLLENC